MRLSLFLDPQEGMTYEMLVAATRRADKAGFHGVYRSDHLTSTAGRFERNATEAWTTLAALGAVTDRVRLGTLITPIGFRHPSLYAKMINTVDEISNGRVDVSIGTGWYGPEHTKLGLPFPEIKERFDQLDEYLQVLMSVWGQQPGPVDGRYFRTDGFQIAPPSVQHPRPWLIIGGHGPRRTPRLAAQYADEFNVDWLAPDHARTLNDRVDAACVEIGRDPEQVVRSVLLGGVLAETPSEVPDELAGAGRFLGLDDPQAWAEQNTAGWTVGTYQDLMNRIGEYGAVGIDHVILMLAPGDDLEKIDTVAKLFDEQFGNPR